MLLGWQQLERLYLKPHYISSVIGGGLIALHYCAIPISLFNDSGIKRRGFRFVDIEEMPFGVATSLYSALNTASIGKHSRLSSLYTGMFHSSWMTMISSEGYHYINMYFIVISIKCIESLYFHRLHLTQDDLQMIAWLLIWLLAIFSIPSRIDVAFDYWWRKYWGLYWFHKRD